MGSNSGVGWVLLLIVVCVVVCGLMGWPGLVAPTPAPEDGRVPFLKEGDGGELGGTEAVLAVAVEIAAAQKATAELGLAGVQATRGAEEAAATGRAIEATEGALSLERTATVEAEGRRLAATQEAGWMAGTATRAAEGTLTALEVMAMELEATQTGEAAAYERTATAAAEGTQAAGTLTAEGLRLRQTEYAFYPTQTADALMAQLVQAQVNEEAVRMRMESERVEMTNAVRAWYPALAALVLAAILGPIAWRMGGALVGTMKVVKDGQGKPVLVVDQGLNQVNVVLPSRSVGPGVVSSSQGISSLAAPLEVQERVTARAQAVEAIAAADGKNPPRPPLLRGEKEGAHAMRPYEGDEGFGYLPMAAEWGAFVRHMGPEIPLGVGRDGGLMLAHPEVYPHFTVAGRTGGGKTRYGVRAKIAAALVRGWYVVTLGQMAPVGLHVFAGYPNYEDVVVEEPAQALAFLERLYGEIGRRMRLLYERKEGRWEGMVDAGPRVMVVVDEYAAMYDDLQGEQRTRYVRAVTNVCRMARKAGIHLVLGVQNPTAESMRPSIRRNTLTQVFQVVDAQASRAIIEQDGAERLSGGQYLAMMQEGVQAGAAFDPTDAQLALYLAERRGRVSVYEAPGWVKLLSARAGEEAYVDETAGRHEVDRLREFLEGYPKASKNAMCMHLWGKPNAGGYASKIDGLLLLLRGSGGEEGGDG